MELGGGGGEADRHFFRANTPTFFALFPTKAVKQVNLACLYKPLESKLC